MGHLTSPIIECNRCPMNEPRADQTARSAKPLSLSNMAHSVLAVLEQRKTTSFSQVADLIVESIGQASEFDSENDQRTLRRRVYDVLNVFLAAGFVVKEGKTLKYVPGALERRTPDAIEDVRKRLHLKLGVLCDNLKLLIYMKLLIERNSRRSRALGAVQLPCMFVGFSDVGNGEITKTLSGRQLQIVVPSVPLFFSPMNVYDCIGFSTAEQIRILRQLRFRSLAIPPRLLATLEPLMFPTVRERVHEEIGTEVKAPHRPPPEALMAS